jgi:hypothetical protein
MVIETIIIYLLSLLGIIAGFIVSMIAVEELKSGRRYFPLIKKIILLIIAILISFYFLKEKVFVGLFIWILTLISLLFIETKIKIKKSVIEVGYYLSFLFVMISFEILQFTKNATFNFASLIMMYGILVGTQLHIKLILSNDKK